MDDRALFRRGYMDGRTGCIGWVHYVVFAAVGDKSPTTVLYWL